VGSFSRSATTLRRGFIAFISVIVASNSVPVFPLIFSAPPIDSVASPVLPWVYTRPPTHDSGAKVCLESRGFLRALTGPRRPTVPLHATPLARGESGPPGAAALVLPHRPHRSAPITPALRPLVSATVGFRGCSALRRRSTPTRATGTRPPPCPRPSTSRPASMRRRTGRRPTVARPPRFGPRVCFCSCAPTTLAHTLPRLNDPLDPGRFAVTAAGRRIATSWFLASGGRSRVLADLAQPLLGDDAARRWGRRSLVPQAGASPRAPNYNSSCPTGVRASTRPTPDERWRGRAWDPVPLPVTAYAGLG